MEGPAAAGFSLNAASFEAFRMQLIKHANDHIQEEDMQAELDIDIELSPSDLDIATIERLAALEPFATATRRCLCDARMQGAFRRQIGKGHYLCWSNSK